MPLCYPLWDGLPCRARGPGFRPLAEAEQYLSYMYIWRLRWDLGYLWRVREFVSCISPPKKGGENVVVLVK